MHFCIILLLSLLLTGCDDASPVEPIGTIGGVFELVSPPVPPTRFARISLNPYTLTFVLEQATAEGVTETRGEFVYDAGSLTFTPDGESGTFTCTFEGYRVLHCGDSTYRMVDYASFRNPDPSTTTEYTPGVPPTFARKLNDVSPVVETDGIS